MPSMDRHSCDSSLRVLYLRARACECQVWHFRCSRRWIFIFFFSPKINTPSGASVVIVGGRQGCPNVKKRGGKVKISKPKNLAQPYWMPQDMSSSACNCSGYTQKQLTPTSFLIQLQKQKIRSPVHRGTFTIPGTQGYITEVCTLIVSASTGVATAIYVCIRGIKVA